MGTANPHAEERLARQRHRQLAKARRIKAQRQARERERAERARQRAAEREQAKKEREFQASLAEDTARQLSIVYSDEEVAELALAGWQRRGIASVVEPVRTKGGRDGYAVMYPRA